MNKLFCKNIENLSVVDRDIIKQIQGKTLYELLKYIQNNYKNIHSVIITVDNSITCNLFEVDKFIKFIRKFGKRIFFENIKKNNKHTEQQSFFEFILNEESVEYILNKFNLEEHILLPCDIYFRQNDKCVIAIIEFASTEYEPEIVLKTV